MIYLCGCEAKMRKQRKSSPACDSSSESSNKTINKPKAEQETTAARFKK